MNILKKIWLPQIRIPKRALLIVIVLGIVSLIASSFSSCPVGGVPTHIVRFPFVTEPTVPSQVSPFPRVTQKNYTRTEASTFQKLPEWFIVYSAHEYAECLRAGRPSQFPYLASVRQYWSYFNTVNAQTKARNQFNPDDNVVNIVIGISFTVENIGKALYENSIGRISEITSFHTIVEEDIFAQRVAQEYATFLHMTPWYEFPWGAKFMQVWTEPRVFGVFFIRKWERKLALSAEYGTKYIYAWLIRTATQSSFAPEASEIFAVTSKPSRSLNYTGIKARPVSLLTKDIQLLALPRYELFTGAVMELAHAGVQFLEIAGNDEIMITAIAPKQWQYSLPHGTVLTSVDILTRPDYKRLAILVRVPLLSHTLQSLAWNKVFIEHIYDY